MVRYLTRSSWKMFGPFTTASRLTPIHQVSPVVLSRAACASMSTTPTTTTTTTARNRGDRYSPVEWAQQEGLAVASIVRDDPSPQQPQHRRRPCLLGIVWWLQLWWLAQPLCSRHALRSQCACMHCEPACTAILSACVRIVGCDRNAR